MGEFLLGHFPIYPYTRKQKKTPKVYIRQNVFLLSQKEHVPFAQNPFSSNPLVAILGKVTFIVLRPVFIFCYFGV